MYGLRFNRTWLDKTQFLKAFQASNEIIDRKHTDPAKAKNEGVNASTRSERSIPYSAEIKSWYCLKTEWVKVCIVLDILM
jgi:hypothetical protein